LLKLNEEKQAQEIARAREESQWAWKHTLYHTEERARLEEREKAEIEKLEIAKRLRNSGMSAHEVAKHTGLSEDQILKIEL
jgi:DNA invertase Pin-like site-specific DNA recombinase